MAENTSDNREGTDFTGFLEDAVEKHRVLVSHKVAILKKKQGQMGQWDQAGTSQDEPSTSSSTVINYVQREPCPYGDDINHWCMNLDQHPGETAPGVDTSKPVLYMYDEDRVDQFEDFFEAIEEGDDAIREYVEFYEHCIFNEDSDDLDKQLTAMEKNK